MRRVLTVAGPSDSRSAYCRESSSGLAREGGHGRGQHGEVAVEAGNHGGDGDTVEGEGVVAEMAMAGEIRRRGRRGKYSSRESWVDAALASA
jgi:hypothetical protein